MPHSGSAEPAGSPRVQEPSLSPGTFTHSFASRSGEPVLRVVGRSPRPRPGGLHQSCGSLYVLAGGVHGPWPLRLAAIPECPRPGAGGTWLADHASASAGGHDRGAPRSGGPVGALVDARDLETV